MLLVARVRNSHSTGQHCLLEQVLVDVAHLTQASDSRSQNFRISSCKPSMGIILVVSLPVTCTRKKVSWSLPSSELEDRVPVMSFQ